MRVSEAQLHQLASLYGIRTSYLDMDHCTKSASSTALLAVLKSMEAPVAKLADVPSAIREKRQHDWQLPLEPVIVVWENEILSVNLRLPASMVDTSIIASLYLETGEQKDLVWRTDECSVLGSIVIERIKYVNMQLYFPEKLPLGYHRLRLELPGRIAEALVISAPLQSYFSPGLHEKIWGVFLPLYALQTHQSWGSGDFSDLETLMKWVSGLGGNMVGTLPLLPSFFNDKLGPGPYMPASRLFWNEFYLDINRIPGLNECPRAQTLINSDELQQEIASLHNSSRVNYQRLLSLKRNILKELSECFFTDSHGSELSVEQASKRVPDFRNFLKSHNQAADYARFRAAGEQYGICWYDWPDRMRNGKLKEGDYDEKIARYYLYSQWITQEQINKLCQISREKNVFLYLDLPVGVHPYSYDVWRDRKSFVFGVNGGAPPDPVFTSGQNWGFPPLHPENIRLQGYRYVINSLRHQLQQAGMLRIDHIMNFHRLFWIPEKMENRDGVYVNYRADELYAILSLESCRNKSVIIGEDLGMVPPEVRPTMEKHGIFRLFVGQYELITENQLGKIPSYSAASLNTHDMFPFAAFWEEMDIAERQKLKLLDEKMAQKELEQRRRIKMALISILQYRGLYNEVSQDTQTILKAVLQLLAASSAYALLINLEDLWLETRPQNIPGTRKKRNWSQKAHCTFEQFSHSPLILEVLQEINHIRKGG